MSFIRSPHFKFVALIVVVLAFELMYLVKDRFGNFNPVESTPMTYEQQADFKYRKWLESERTKKKIFIDPVKFKLEQSFIENGQVWLYYIDSTIQHGIHDFPHHPDYTFNSYGALYAVYLPEEVCKALSVAQKNLKKEYPYYNLMVMDGTRAFHVDSTLRDTLSRVCGHKSFTTQPNHHHYGAAVDMIIVDEKGFAQDMGCDYNIFSELGLKDPKQKENNLTNRQKANRELLKNAMQSAGFKGSASNCWHFEYGTLAQAAEKYKRIN